MDLSLSKDSMKLTISSIDVHNMFSTELGFPGLPPQVPSQRIGMGIIVQTKDTSVDAITNLKDYLPFELLLAEESYHVIGRVNYVNKEEDIYTISLDIDIDEKGQPRRMDRP